ncbi:MAG: tryptophan 7-halogenase, partial [Holophagales bacterium]|nr:tryptophan 7-halogenase [Holophagales bacterium]
MKPGDAEIVIVGGGLAAWVAACYLRRSYGDGTTITVLDDPAGAPIGVGEGTTPIAIDLFRRLGLREEDWMPACGATYKLGIRFDCWLHGGPDDRYWHSFGSAPMDTGGRPGVAQLWLRRWLDGERRPFATVCNVGPALCEAERAPRTVAADHGVPYAYHFDAGRLARLLKEHAEALGVRVIADAAIGAERAGDGALKGVVTRTHGLIAGDLFVDCTGFAARLIEGELDERWHDERRFLPCDRAVAVKVPYADGDGFNEAGGGLPPFTTARATTAGWLWSIPQIGACGHGYVYASDFETPEGAELRLRRALGIGDDLSARHLEARIGHRRRAWVHNCVAIGLSAGFVEPLEATGLALIQVGLGALVQHWRRADDSELEGLRGLYNDFMLRTFLNVRDFVVLHYVLSRRDDSPFWRAMRRDEALPESLRDHLRRWRTRLPTRDAEAGTVFGPYNWISVLAGME